ncbi:MAG: hypothetical protein MUD08_11605 [Cytophagales bacterium]|jgi:iron-sulfur cluster repair protein YtfE (RIC family)|nr:hypothetical protein [Cytophagales bacterium]
MHSPENLNDLTEFLGRWHEQHLNRRLAAIGELLHRHADTHPELTVLADWFGELREMLRLHGIKETRFLFRHIRLRQRTARLPHGAAKP